jgi:hypothetical protein
MIEVLPVSLWQRLSHMRRIALTVVSWLALAAGVAAQESPHLPVGTRVRISLKDQVSRPLVASWLGLLDSHLELQGEEGEAIRLPLASITRLDRSIGTRKNAKTGALVGLAFGGVVGAIAGKTTDPYSDCWGNAGEGECRLWLWGGMLFGAVGAGVGALIGQAIRTDIWERVPLSVTPGSGGRGWVLRWTIPVPGRRVGTWGVQGEGATPWPGADRR